MMGFTYWRTCSFFVLFFFFFSFSLRTCCMLNSVINIGSFSWSTFRNTRIASSRKLWKPLHCVISSKCSLSSCAAFSLNSSFELVSASMFT
uniref:Putative secreted protein n=1 Tax=Anopheles darlingi TaxID=43151 RepID=A0A2M4D6L2_ANODA